MKFYTVCGKKYAEISNMDMAEVCYKKATEFQKAAGESEKNLNHGSRAVSKAIFDLLVSKAACAWDLGDHTVARVLVNDAREYIRELPEDADFLASIQYNFGLFKYQEKDTTEALEWLSKSLETRASVPEQLMNPEKQAKTARLAGLCMLTINRFDEASEMMRKAEQLFHDPVGAYILLKIAVVTKSSNVAEHLSSIVNDPESSLDVCMASAALVADAQQTKEALQGYKRIMNRFSSDADALVFTVGPKYFDGLAAIGKVSEAVKVLSDCCDVIVLQSQQYKTAATKKDNRLNRLLCFYQVWADKALSAACALVGRKDFMAATLLLKKALDISDKMCEFIDTNDLKQGKKQKSHFEKNEPAICRLLASCAITCLSKLEINEKTRLDRVNADEIEKNDQNEADNVSSKESIIAAAISNAKRAKNLDREDCSARLLLFRAYLLQNRPDLAAEEMQDVSSQISYFEAGSMAEAAFSARECGSKESELTALNCILMLPANALHKSLVESPKKPYPGFFGSVFVSFITIVTSHAHAQSNNEECSIDTSNLENQYKEEFTVTPEVLLQVLSAMRSGLDGIRTIGLETAFGNDGDRREASLGYLASVCWNCGRQANIFNMNDICIQLFDMCYDLNALNAKSEEVTNSMLVSRLMAAACSIYGEQSDKDRYSNAKKRLDDAKSLFESFSTESCPLKNVAVRLLTKCFIGMNDNDSLACCIASLCREPSADPKLLEQLASICVGNAENLTCVNSESRARRNEFASSLRNAAVELRLCSPEENLEDLAVTLRELIESEIARGESGNRSFVVFSKALGLVKEKSDIYPKEEKRWLAAVAWNRAELLGRINRVVEAKQWAQSAIDIVSLEPTLSTFLPKMVRLKDALAGSDDAL